MSVGSDSLKLQEWSDRLERFGQSGQTVAEFCRAEGVSAPSFYQWRRRLGSTGRKGKRSASRGRQSSAFQRLDVGPPDVWSAVRIRLPDGMVLELGNDPATIERIVGKVLDHRANGVGGC